MNALHHIDAAIDALTNEVEHVEDSAFGRTTTTRSAIETSIAMDVERIAGAIGAGRGTLLYALAESIREAVIELHAARAAIGGRG